MYNENKIYIFLLICEFFSDRDRVRLVIYGILGF